MTAGSRTAGTLEIGGGPANVHNNIVIDGATAGIYAYKTGLLQGSTTSVYSNRAERHGGGVYLESVANPLETWTITDNVAGADGGGLYAQISN